LVIISTTFKERRERGSERGRERGRERERERERGDTERDRRTGG